MALEGMNDKHPGVNNGPANAGKPWEHTEDDQLKAEFDNRLPIKELAQKHQRTLLAIEARLIKLGKLMRQPDFDISKHQG